MGTCFTANFCLKQDAVSALKYVRLQQQQNNACLKCRFLFAQEANAYAKCILYHQQCAVHQKKYV